MSSGTITVGTFLSNLLSAILFIMAIVLPVVFFVRLRRYRRTQVAGDVPLMERHRKECRRAGFFAVGIWGLLVALIAFGFIYDAMTFRCDRCIEKFTGASYYGSNGDETMCETCARKYWIPYKYRDYKN